VTVRSKIPVLLRRYAPLPPLDVPWASRLRPVSSAEISVRTLDDGRLEQRVVHAPMPGVTRPMLRWWMDQIDRRVEWDGRSVLAYRLWHPLDHIDFEIRRTGDRRRFHIVEAFQANPRYLMNVVFDVPRLDDHGFRLELHPFGIPVATVDEDWEDVPGGVRWIAAMRVGPVHPILGPLWRLDLRFFRRPMLTAWLRHNVEEGGCIPEFLPKLYRALA
jgi:hypothetical protein